MSRTVDAAARLPRLRSLLVLRNGETLAEHRFNGGPPLDRPVNIKSASKSVLSALVGIAIGRGVLSGVDQPVLSVLRADAPTNSDPRLARVTVGNLLSMHAGLERTSGENYGRWVSSPNWVRFALSRPFIDEPGGDMLHSTGSTHLLSAMLTRASGRNTHQLAQEWLAAPLDVAIPAWPRDPQGIYFGGNDMLMSPRALARFGELYRLGGILNGRRVLPTSWIEQSWTPRAVSPWSGGRYGYGWFIGDAGGRPVRFAWGYGPHVSEQIVGEALQPVRNQVVIASKFGFEVNPGSSASRNRNARPAHIRVAVEGMLRRLRTDRIDLLYLHRMDPQVPVEDIAGTVRDLIREGKARHFGMSEVSPATIRRAHAVQPIAAIQSEYSLVERLPEVAVLDVCAELGIGFVPWGPTGRALLADQFNEYSRFAEADRRSEVPFFTPAALEANMAVVNLARAWADRKGATPVQFALAWLLAERPFIVPIPGTTKLHHLRENLGALDVRITPQELGQFRSQLAQLRVVGARQRGEALRDQ